jgi:hypothetical protein
MGMMRLTLQQTITLTAAQCQANGGVMDNVVSKSFGGNAIKKLLAILRIVSADRTNTDETYDFYLTAWKLLASGNYARWDLVHFPQIAAAAAAIYTADVKDMGPYPQNVTTAGPGVAAVTTATMAVVTAGANQGIRTLGAGLIRHGNLGEGLSYSLATGGTTAGPISFELDVSAWF